MIDVREQNERDEGYIPDSRNIPYRLVGEYADELANGKTVVTVCESGAPGRGRRERPRRARDPRPPAPGRRHCRLASARQRGDELPALRLPVAAKAVACDADLEGVPASPVRPSSAGGRLRRRLRGCAGFAGAPV